MLIEQKEKENQQAKGQNSDMTTKAKPIARPPTVKK